MFVFKIRSGISEFWLLNLITLSNNKWTLKLIRFKCFLPSRHIHAAIRTSWTGRTWRGWHRGRVILLFLFIFFPGQLRQFGPFWRLNYLESANISNIPGRIQKLANFGNTSSHSESNGAYNCEIILNSTLFFNLISPLICRYLQ